MTITEPTACAKVPALFDDETASSPAQQKMLRKICWSCPVQPTCYLVAIETPVEQLSGFMAGLTERQRADIQRAAARRRKKVA